MSNKYLILKKGETPFSQVVNDCETGFCFPVGKGENLSTVIKKMCSYLSKIKTEETDPYFRNSVAHDITAADITNWDLAYSWGNHAGLYSLLGHTHSLLDLTQSNATTGQVPVWNGTEWEPQTIGGGGGPESDPIFTTWLSGVPNLSEFNNDVGYLTSVGLADVLNVNNDGGNIGLVNIPSIGYSNTNTAIDITNRILKTSNVSSSVNWETRELIDGIYGTSVDWYNRRLIDPSLNNVITWDNGVVINGLLYPSSDGSNGYVLTTDGFGTLTFAPISETDPIYSASTWFSTTNNSTDWNTAYSWGNHALAGYLTSYSETDPIYSASSWFTTTNNASNWDTAFGWGNHASAGYLTTISGLNISSLTNDSGYITSSALSPYLTSATAASTYQPLDADLTSIAALGFTSTAFLKKTAANTWALDTSTYLTSISGLNISLLTNDSGYITSSALSPYLTSATAASTYFPLLGGSITGTAGAGFFGAIAQSSNPSTPTSGFRLFANSTHALSWIGQNGYIRTFDGTANTADRTYTLPNISGTLPLGTGTANELTYWSGTNTISTLTTATYPSLTELSYVKGVTSSIQPQIDAAKENHLIKAYNAMGSPIKAQSLDLGMHNIGSAATIGSTNNSRLTLIAIYLETPQTITGVKWYQGTLGSYTANNENRVGLYTVSGGTLTLVASCANDGNLWQTVASNTFGAKAFSSTYAASPGLYYIGLLYSNSAVTTAPTIGISSNVVNSNVQSGDFSNGLGLQLVKTTVVALPSSITASTYTQVQQQYWAAIY